MSLLLRVELGNTVFDYLHNRYIITTINQHQITHISQPLVELLLCQFFPRISPIGIKYSIASTTQVLEWNGICTTSPTIPTMTAWWYLNHHTNNTPRRDVTTTTTVHTHNYYNNILNRPKASIPFIIIQPHQIQFIIPPPTPLSPASLASNPPTPTPPQPRGLTWTQTHQSPTPTTTLTLMKHINPWHVNNKEGALRLRQAPHWTPLMDIIRDVCQLNTSTPTNSNQLRSIKTHWPRFQPRRNLIKQVDPNLNPHLNYVNQTRHFNLNYVNSTISTPTWTTLVITRQVSFQITAPLIITRITSIVFHLYNYRYQGQISHAYFDLCFLN